MANGHDTTDRIYQGRQLPICGNGTIPDPEQPVRPAKLEGVVLSTAGTYYYSMATTGAAEIDVTLRPSATSGTVTMACYPTLRDGVTIKGTETAFTAPVAGTQETKTLQSLRGVRMCVLKIVVSGASSITFDQAEFSTL
jgi:hypothetical protein